MLNLERAETRAAGMMSEAKRRKDEKHIQTCKGKIRYQLKSLSFGKKTKINISKDCFTVRNVLAAKIKNRREIKKMNILLTGGAGYIGSHTIIELDKAGHSVVVVDNLVNSNPESLRRVSKIIGKEIPFCPPCP